MANNERENAIKDFVEQTESNNSKTMTTIKAEPLTKGKVMSSEPLIDVVGFQEIPVKDLPTKGLFYPDDVRILIRAATAGEIRHWSTMNQESISDVYDHLNYIIEKCVYFKLPNGTGNWKMLKEMDRMYLLFAVRDFTFVEGDNELKMKITETKEITIHKDNIEFINIPDEIMKHYSAEEHCFVFNFNTGRTIRMYIPSIGTSMWLKQYMQTKESTKQGYDKDFIQLAPMLIPDNLKLSNRSYEDFVISCADWGIKEVSLISHVYDLLLENSTPKITYIDEAGAEQTAPLTFPDGFKVIFTISNIFDGLL